MPTPVVLKNQIDAQITNKTLPWSIDNKEVGARLKDIIDLIGDKQFNTTQERLDYLNSSDSYPGQVVYDKQDGNLYFINRMGDGYTILGSSSGGIEIVTFTNQTNLVIQWNTVRKIRFGLAGIFAVEILGDDGKYRQTSVEVVPDNIVDTDNYFIDLGGECSGRVIIK